MQHDRELQDVIYELIKTQIEFGVHRYGEPLPTIKDAAKYFLASVDTVRLAYVRLKDEGYISLITGVGATVQVQYSDEEIRRKIRNYFSRRKHTLLAFARSAHSLFGNAQWLAWKNISSEALDEVERICSHHEVSPPYRMSRQLILIYGTLGNDLFIRLIWQMFLFFQGPFLSVLHNDEYFRKNNNPVLDMIRLCRAKNWPALQIAFEDYEQQCVNALDQFYVDYMVPEEATEEQVEFSWSIYKKASQLCYSLGIELLTEIGKGGYPMGSYLPSPARLAAEKGVGLATVRRTISLLNKLGATQSINGIGTKVLLLQDSGKNCDFKDATIQKRLLDFVQNFHILSLSCRACAQSTIESMTPDLIRGWVEQLETVKHPGPYVFPLSCCYEQIALHSPFLAVRRVYTELVGQFFWGFPLWNLHGDQDAASIYFLPDLEGLQDCLRRADGAGFGERLERLQIAETKYVVKYLGDLGISGADSILIP